MSSQDRPIPTRKQQITKTASVFTEPESFGSATTSSPEVSS